MNKLLKTLFFTLSLILLVGTTQAQDYRKPQRSNNTRPNREQLAQKQARHIAHELAMDEATSEKFIATFCNFQQELWALGPRMPKLSKEQRGTSVEDASEASIKARFERSQQILNLREKYYAEYSKFLTQKQIERVYELERQMMNRFKRKQNQANNRNIPPKKTR